MNHILIKQTVTSAKKPFKRNFSKDTDYRKLKDQQHM